MRSVPAIPPAVLKAAVVPTSPPTRCARAISRAAAGNAAPRNVVGTSSTTAAATAKRAPTSTVSLPVARIAHIPAKVWASGSHAPSSATIARALAPAPASRTPSALQGSRPRPPRRANR